MGRYIGIAVGIIVVILLLAWIFGAFEDQAELEVGGSEVEVEENGEVEVEGTPLEPTPTE